jgi:hypothetical protein
MGQEGGAAQAGIIRETLGRLLAAIGTAASVSDNAIGVDLLDEATTLNPILAKTWVTPD